MALPLKQIVNERTMIANPDFIPAPALPTGRNEYTIFAPVAS
jgi:hypothetical protein